LRGVIADRLKPRFFPEQHTRGLASGVSGAVAASVLKMNAIAQAARRYRINCIARLMRTAKYAHAFAAKLEHFRHEGHAFEAALLVKRAQNLVLAANQNPVASTGSH
jgi:hypothetical protein